MALTLHVEQRTRLRKFDWNLAFVILALNVIGLINVYSATHGTHATETSRLFLQQVAWLVVGWLIYALVTFLDYRLLIRFAWVLYILNVIFLVAVNLFGKVSLGAQRWLDLGFFRYQPSETMKIALVLVLTPILARVSPHKKMGIKDLLLPAVVLLIPFILTIKQPDLGTAMTLGGITTCMVLFVGVRKKILVAILIATAVAVPVAWERMHQYQRDRILTFIDPGRDPRGSGYNSIQSKIAVGSGRFLGKGFRKGTQAQLEFLPEQHTDFIFSVLSEEHGFVGSMTTIALFATLMILGIRIASQAREKTGTVLAIGILSTLFVHFAVNIGMVIGILPIVGIPLPLVSYGGSSMITIMFGFGLVSSVSMRKFLF